MWGDRKKVAEKMLLMRFIPQTQKTKDSQEQRFFGWVVKNKRFAVLWSWSEMKKSRNDGCLEAVPCSWSLFRCLLTFAVGWTQVNDRKIASSQVLIHSCGSNLKTLLFLLLSLPLSSKIVKFWAKSNDNNQSLLLTSTEQLLMSPKLNYQCRLICSLITGM